MRRVKGTLSALAILTFASCDQPGSYTGVIVNKTFRTSRYKESHYLYIIDSTGSHCIRVDETTYHKYNIGDVATIEVPKRLY